VDFDTAYRRPLMTNKNARPSRSSIGFKLYKTALEVAIRPGVLTEEIHLPIGGSNLARISTRAIYHFPFTYQCESIECGAFDFVVVGRIADLVMCWKR
jgi:hypothetical protein